MPPLGLNHILAFFFGLLVLYLVAKLLYFPLKVMLRLLGNAVIGGCFFSYLMPSVAFGA